MSGACVSIVSPHRSLCVELDAMQPLRDNLCVAVRNNASFVSPADQATGASPLPTDLLSAVLRELRFESATYRWLELGAPYRIGFDQPGLRGVHLITQGT